LSSMSCNEANQKSFSSVGSTHLRKTHGPIGEILWIKGQGFESRLLPTPVGAPLSLESCRSYSLWGEQWLVPKDTRVQVKLASLNVKQSPKVAKVAQRYHVHMNLKRCAEDINDEGMADMASYENGSMDSDNDEQRECLGEA
ncbi:hypothetical protein Tco_1355975, partial [Tanacetum coccineum]